MERNQLAEASVLNKQLSFGNFLIAFYFVSLFFCGVEHAEGGSLAGGWGQGAAPPNRVLTQERVYLVLLTVRDTI